MITITDREVVLPPEPSLTDRQMMELQQAIEREIYDALRMPAALYGPDDKPVLRLGNTTEFGGLRAIVTSGN